MSGNLQMGDRGRIVIPAGIRERRSWHTGTRLVAVETPSGVLLADRADLEDLVRRQLAGRDLVTELLDERRAAAVAEG
ncbi:MAG: AbrB/MazE/SpoVT family DNA-binding domain-containing protein [Pseudolysinimonas sp.]|jgi:AbrB family looped-hinge helix DNA binding protein|uniref:AbrB/MazE/SpoVT family DNA-binding domain-containing protein n=1 Tax=Pseudolysinimonas sp. TaxID=2680009 RepID=UPI003C7568A6